MMAQCTMIACFLTSPSVHVSEECALVPGGKCGSSDNVMEFGQISRAAVDSVMWSARTDTWLLTKSCEQACLL
jgi:hypothetical protein